MCFEFFVEIQISCLQSDSCVRRVFSRVFHSDQRSEFHYELIREKPPYMFSRNTNVAAPSVKNPFLKCGLFILLQPTISQDSTFSYVWHEDHFARSSHSRCVQLIPRSHSYRVPIASKRFPSYRSKIFSSV